MAAKTGRPNAAGLWLATGSDARNALPLVRMNLDRKAPRLRSPVPRHRRLGSRARGVAVVPKQRRLVRAGSRQNFATNYLCGLNFK